MRPVSKEKLISIHTVATYNAVMVACVVVSLYIFLIRPAARYLYPKVSSSLHAFRNARQVKRTRETGATSCILSLSVCRLWDWALQLKQYLPCGPHRKGAVVNKAVRSPSPLGRSPSPPRRSASTMPTSAFATPDTVTQAPHSSRPTASPPSPPTRSLEDKESISPLRFAKISNPHRSLTGPVHDTTRRAVSSTHPYSDGKVSVQPSGAPQIDQLVQKVFTRQQRWRKYHDTNITESALNDLYDRPAFQAWYTENRSELLERVQQCRYTAVWRGVTGLLVLLIALTAVPAFDFNNQAKTLTLVKSSGPSATFAQLIRVRVAHLQSREDLAFIPSITPGQKLLVTVVSEMELLALSTAVVAMLVSTFMPRGMGFTAATAVTSLVVLLAECGSATDGRLRCGMGAAILIGTAAIAVARAA